MARLVNIISLCFAFFCSLIVMSLIGNMIASAYHNNPSVVNYSMFTAAFGMFTLFFLIPAAFKEDLIPLFAVIIVLGLDVLFWFTNAIALAAELKCHSCNNVHYRDTNKITNGSRTDRKGRCQEAQASTAFLWFGWFAFTISFVVTLLGARGSGASVRVPHRRGPSMAQV